MEIGKQIKKYRTEIELSQEGLAEQIFVSRQTISNWENNKNYPDIKSLLLLSSLFNVSLDVLIKGDFEEMKEIIKTEDINNFEQDSKVFSIFLLLSILSPVPLMHFMGVIGIGIWIIIAIISLYYAIRIEKQKKNFNIQTYKEIIVFMEGKNMDEKEKNQEIGKRPYQKILLAIGTALLTLIVAIIMDLILL